MNPFLDSQAQRNTPRGCGFAGACQKLSLLPRKQSKLNQRSQPGRPTRWRRRIRSSRGRNRNGLEKRVQSGGLRRGACRASYAPIAARSSTGSRFCTPLQPPGTTAALAPRALAAKAQHSLCRRARPPPQRPPPPSACTYRRARVNARCTYRRARVRVPPAGAAATRREQDHGRDIKALGRGPTFCR